MTIEIKVPDFPESVADGTLVTWQEARAIITERYLVPEEARKRNSKRARKTQRDRRAERKRKRRSLPGR